MIEQRIAYKATDAAGYSRRGLSGETLWTEGTIVRPTGVGTLPCGPGVLHAYASPEAAVLLHRCHCVSLSRIFRVLASEWQSDGIKRWTSSPVEVIKEVAVPEIALLERTAWAICISPHPSTREWATEWLSDMDRSPAAASAAYTAADAYAAASAADSAAYAAASAAYAADAAAYAADAAVYASYDAASAAVFEQRVVDALDRARAILAGEWPADRFDEPLEVAP
jgi:hypothetical protein